MASQDQLEQGVVDLWKEAQYARARIDALAERLAALESRAAPAACPGMATRAQRCDCDASHPHKATACDEDCLGTCDAATAGKQHKRNLPPDPNWCPNWVCANPAHRAPEAPPCGASITDRNDEHREYRCRLVAGHTGQHVHDVMTHWSDAATTPETPPAAAVTLPPQPPGGKVLKCPDCAQWYSLAENALHHRLQTGHGPPAEQDEPAAPGVFDLIEVQEGKESRKAAEQRGREYLGVPPAAVTREELAEALRKALESHEIHEWQVALEEGLATLSRYDAEGGTRG